MKYRTGNEGMSLVELIVVVAILALLQGHYLQHELGEWQGAEECAQSLPTACSRQGLWQWGKNSITITVKRDAEGFIVTETTIVSTRTAHPLQRQKTSRLGKKTVTVKFSDGSSESELGMGGVKLVLTGEWCVKDIK